MIWKKIEDWFVESAAFLVVRTICAVVGGGIVLLGGPGMMDYSHYGEGSAVEQLDRAFYGWLTFAAATAIFFAIAGPKLLHAIVDYYRER